MNQFLILGYEYLRGAILSVTYMIHMQQRYTYFGGIILLTSNQMTHSIRIFFNCAYFVVPFNYFERFLLVVFMYHMLIINQEVACCKSTMPYDCPPHVANSS